MWNIQCIQCWVWNTNSIRENTWHNGYGRPNHFDTVCIRKYISTVIEETTLDKKKKNAEATARVGSKIGKYSVFNCWPFEYTDCIIWLTYLIDLLFLSPSARQAWHSCIIRKLIELKVVFFTRGPTLHIRWYGYVQQSRLLFLPLLPFFRTPVSFSSLDPTRAQFQNLDQQEKFLDNC